MMTRGFFDCRSWSKRTPLDRGESIPSWKIALTIVGSGKYNSTSTTRIFETDRIMQTLRPSEKMIPLLAGALLSVDLIPLHSQLSPYFDLSGHSRKNPHPTTSSWRSNYILEGGGVLGRTILLATRGIPQASSIEWRRPSSKCGFSS